MLARFVGSTDVPVAGLVDFQLGKARCEESAVRQPKSPRSIEDEKLAISQLHHNIGKSYSSSTGRPSLLFLC